MKSWKFVLAGATALGLIATAGMASAKTFKWSFQGDVQSLDPHGLNETFTLGYLGNVYEALVSYDAALQVQPGLATAWENTAPTPWIFELREGVPFHNGNPFAAQDVVLSWQRSLTPGSDVKGFGAKIAEIEVLTPHKIQVTTPSPNPILPRE